jgi:hypothetical protein
MSGVGSPICALWGRQGQLYPTFSPSTVNPEELCEISIVYLRPVNVRHTINIYTASRYIFTDEGLGCSTDRRTIMIVLDGLSLMQYPSQLTRCD